jgi:hypothetical protein
MNPDKNQDPTVADACGRPVMTGTETRLRDLLTKGQLELPQPGRGQTRQRFDSLQQLAATEDLSVARLAEAHCDAAAIVAESGRALPPGMLAGVWASRYGGGSLTATPAGDGHWRISGRLRFCSGAPLLDVALVDARLPDRREQLFLMPLCHGGVNTDTTEWRTTALAATATGTVDIDLVVGNDACVGEPGFYLSRPGFWHGAIGVAACWAGGGRAVHESTLAHIRSDQIHAVTNVGRSAAACWAMSAMLDAAADTIDTRPQTSTLSTPSPCDSSSPPRVTTSSPPADAPPGQDPPSSTPPTASASPTCACTSNNNTTKPTSPRSETAHSARVESQRIGTAIVLRARTDHNRRPFWRDVRLPMAGPRRPT